MQVFYDKRITNRDIVGTVISNDGVNDRYDRHIITFCTIQQAFNARRNPNVAWSRGVIFDPDVFKHSFYSSYIDEGYLLNPDGIYLPYGNVVGMVNWLDNHFGGDLFIRPESGNKPFTGFDTYERDSASEIAAYRQTCAIQDHEMVFITNHKKIEEIEYRFWIYEGTVVGASSYSWTHGLENKTVPLDAYEMVENVTENLQYVMQTYVVDVARYEGEYRVIELNAFSTSGWYEGLDHNEMIKLIEGMEP